MPALWGKADIGQRLSNRSGLCMHASLAAAFNFLVKFQYGGKG